MILINEAHRRVLITYIRYYHRTRTQIGLPTPDLLAALVGTFEITCGSLVLLGLMTRLGAVPLIAIMAVALTTTKFPMLADQGFWSMAHEMRTDWSMLLGSLFLLIVGAGPLSLDAQFTTHRDSAHGRVK